MEKSSSAVALPSKMALTIGAACVLAVREILRRWRLRGTPPGSLGLPVIGESADFIVNPTKFVKDRKGRYGPIFKTGLLFSPTVMLTGEYSKLLTKNPNIGWPQHFMALLGDTAIGAINGPRHKFQRAVCNAAFTDEALASYVPAIEEMTKKHLDLWVAKSSSQGPYDPHEDIKLYTFEIAEKILMGTSSSGALIAPFNMWLGGFEALLPFNLPFTSFGKAMRARKMLLEEYQKVIDAKRATESYENGQDMLSMVMKEGKRGEPMTDEELRDFSISIMFAGHDTTKATIQTMLHFLATMPAIREELEKEVATIWDGTSPLTFEQTQKCQAGKCGRFCAEILRVIPPVGALYRLVTEEMEIGRYRIPKGWKISTSIPEMHQAPNIDMSVDHAALKQIENCPFGFGNRMCIGYKFAKLELIVWLMCMLQHYSADVTASKEIVFPFHYINVQATFSFKIKAYEGC